MKLETGGQLDGKNETVVYNINIWLEITLYMLL